VFRDQEKASAWNIGDRGLLVLDIGPLTRYRQRFVQSNLPIQRGDLGSELEAS
jgi:hypothetical protein